MELIARRQLLKALLDDKGTQHVLFSADFEADAASVLKSACSMHLEGIIAKRADAPYSSRRTETWLKLKCLQRQEFVVCGYTQRSDDPAQIGSLFLGVHNAAGELVSVGKVGTGWDAEEARMLKAKLGKLTVAAPPFKKSPKFRWSRATGSAQWVKPTLVAEVEFAQWTPDRQIRHSSYMALRKDKPAVNIVREMPKQLGKADIKASVGIVKVTHGDRIIDASTGLTKIDLVRYYESVSDWILPHLKGRPCSLVRGPSA